MENKALAEKAGPSRKSDVIILTPDELAKLGLITEILPSIENKKSKNETDDDETKEKQKKQSSKDLKCNTNSKEKNYKPATVANTNMNAEIKHKDKKYVPQIKQPKSSATLDIRTLNKKSDILKILSPRIDATSNINTKLIPVGKEKHILNKKLNEMNVETLNLKNEAGHQEKKHVNTNLPSSSTDIEAAEEFKQTLRRGLSKKLQEFDEHIKYGLKIGSKQNENNATPQKVDTVFKNTVNLTANNFTNQLQSNSPMNIEKKINITGITSLCLSDGELKQLVSKTNRHNASKKLFVSEKLFMKSDDIKSKHFFENIDSYENRSDIADSLNLIKNIEENKIMSNIPFEEGNNTVFIKTIDMDDEIIQNTENDVNIFHTQKSEIPLLNEQKLNASNEKLELLVDVTPTMIPKKRKCYMNSPVDGASEKIMDTKEMSENSVKPINELDDFNISTQLEEDRKNKIVMYDSQKVIKDESSDEDEKLFVTDGSVDTNLPKKRGRPKKMSNVEDISIKEKELLNFSEREKPESNVDIKLPKKRGRPKKISNVEDNNDLVSALITDMKNNESVVATETQVEQVVSTPLPKKRGRKKKSEQLASEEIPSSVAENVELDESRSGRRRRKVNYLELANELEETPDDELQRKQMFSIQRIENIIVKRENTDDQVEGNLLHEISKENEQGELDSNENNTFNHIELEKTEGETNDLTSALTTDISDITNNDSVTVKETDVEQTSCTPLPKKRGRKKKSELLASQVVSDVIENVELDESRSGRKRRKVNYLEFANELEENADTKPKKKPKFSIQNIERIIDKSEKTDDQVEENSFHDISKENEQMELDSTENNTLKHTELDKTEGSVEVEGNSNKMVEDEIDNDKIENKKKSKYRKTGETVMMINSVFAAAFKNNSMRQTENDLNVSSESSFSLSNATLDIKSKSGRKKKTFTNISVDKDNMVTCTTCNGKVNNDGWVEHNRQEHNNLAWRAGEPEIALDNGLVVSKILKAILKEDKEIICKKCKNSFAKVSAFTNHMEKCSGIISSSGNVTCAICKTEMEKTKWPNHKQRQHNNLAWRVGDRPLNLNDKNVVISILTTLYKAKKPLYCEKCGESKKSVIGFLSHQSQCGEKLEEVKVQCQFCDRKVLPVSMQTHIKMVHEKPKEKILAQDASYFDVDTDTVLKKRKAATTAMLVINKISGDRMIQEHTKYFLEQINFNEEDFVKLLLKKELSNNNTIKCKFNNCLYESDSVTNVIEHMNSCPEKPEQYYTCRKCLSISASEEGIKEHLKNFHNIDIIDDEYNNAEDEMMEQYDLEMKRGSLYEKLKMEKDPHYKVKPTFILNLPRRPSYLFSEAYSYTMSFCERHYSTEALFKTLRYIKSDWLLLNDDLIGEYLPQYAQSCDVAKIKVSNDDTILGNDYSFKKLDLFESELDEGIVTIFCGGPVQAMAWMPTPYTFSDCRQILAVATVNDFDKKYLINQHHKDQSVIQFWDFGILKNKQAMIEPKLMFCLAYDLGPVWHLEWCPSGCFDIKTEDDDGTMSRMGLLAVAGSDSTVHIYSVPHLKDEQIGMIYKIKPLVRLHLALNEMHSLNRENFYTTKISWSKASGHRYTVVGYTDGMVALFDLDTSSNLLRNKDKDGCEVLLPFRTFQPHTHMVTVIDLIHLGDGKRWLLTGSFDRNIIIWDLTNDFKIVSRRNILSDGLWLTNWIAFISASDESSTKQSSVLTLMASYRDYLYEHVNLTSSPSTVKAISASSWLNGIIYCSAVGEITAMFPPQLLFGLDYDKKLRSYIYSFGYTKLINKHLNPEERLTEAGRDKCNEKEATANDVLTKNKFCDAYEPVTYEECSEKYGLLFCNAKMDSYKNFEDKKTRPKEEVEVSKANLYSLHAINKVAFNPNLQASLYYATGYQAGFVRMTYIKFLENDLQIK